MVEAGKDDEDEIKEGNVHCKGTMKGKDEEEEKGEAM